MYGKLNKLNKTSGYQLSIILALVIVLSILLDLSMHSAKSTSFSCLADDFIRPLA